MEVTIQPNKPVSIYEKPGAKPTPSEPTPPPPTPDELQARAREVGIAMGWEEGKTPSAKPQIPPAAAAPTPSVAVTPIPPTEEPVPSSPPPIPRPEVTMEDTERLIRRTADETARRVTERQQPPTPAAAPTAPPFELGAEDARDYRIIQFMAAQDPAKHGDKPAKFLEVVRRAYDYQDKWEAENPGETFEAGDSSHAEFFKANRQNLDPEELREAELDMKVEEKVRPLREEREREKRQREEAMAMHRSRAEVERQVMKNIAGFVGRVSPELGKLVHDPNGQVNMAEEMVTMVERADPIAFEEMDLAIKEELEPMLIELEKTAVPGLNYQLDPKRNPVHRAIDVYRQEAERDLAGTEFEDGRKFLSIEEMNQRRGEIINGAGGQEERRGKLDELNRQYRTLTVDDMEEIIGEKIAERTRAKIAKRDAAALRKYGGNGRNGVETPPAPSVPPQPAAPTPPPAPTAAPAISSGKPRPPSSGGGVDVATNRGGETPASKTWSQQVNEAAFK